MFASTTNNYSQTPKQFRATLIEGLKDLPQEWVLTPINRNKAPYRKNWQQEKLLRKQLATEIKSGRAKGYGIRTGKVSGGIVAVDADGTAAHDKITELSGGEPLPPTIAFTSNKPGRCQYLFYIPQEYWEAIATKKIGTGVKGDDGKEQKLELRWDGCQSVLPPSVHPETGFYRWRKSPKEVAIAQAPIWLIEAMLNEPVKPETSPRPEQTKLDHRDRAELTEEEWALSYLNALSPSRADDYDEWLAVGMALHSVSDSLLTDWDNWSHQSSKYKPGDCEKKWKSFKSQGVAIGTLAHMAKQDGWRSPVPSGRGYSSGVAGTKKRNLGGGSGGNGGGDDGDNGGNKVINFPGFDPLTIEQIITKIDELIEQNLPNSKLTAELNRLSVGGNIHVIELRKLYNERLNESDQENERTDTKTEIDNLLKIENKTLDLNDYLPHDLSEPLTQWIQWLNIQPQAVLTTLLVGASSLHKTGTELVIHRGQNFTVPPTIFGALVSESGQKKSPIFSNIIRQPLNILKREKQDAYNAAMEDYKEELRQWTENGGEGEPPEKPKEPPIFYFSNATGESIPAYSQKYPEKTLMGLIDELAGHFNSANAYRNGRGSDKQDFLSYFDGLGQTVLRTKEGVRVDAEKLYLSIFGTIQPEVLKRLMEDCSDPDGSWARFLFVNQPLAAATLADDDGHSVQICDRLADYYRKIDQLPEMEYRLSREAFKRYQPVYNQLERLRVTHPNPGMRAVYSKMEGYIGRIAINLHVLWELAAGRQCPSPEIPLCIMEMAINLAKFYIGQVKLIHANSDEESIPADITRLIALSKRREENGDSSRGWIKANAFASTFSKNKRPSAQKARQLFLEAVAMGYGCTRGTGNRLEFHWRCNDQTSSPNFMTPPDTSGQLNDTCHEVESTDFTGVSGSLVTLNDTPPSPSTSGYLQNETVLTEPLTEPSPPENIPPLNECHEVTSKKGCGKELVSDSELNDTCHEVVINCPEVSLSVEEPPVTVAIAEDDEAFISELAEYLQVCDSKEFLADLRATEGFTPEAFKKAASRLPEEKRQQVKQWVIELNSPQSQSTSLPTGTRINYQSEYSGSVAGFNPSGDYFINWDKSSHKLANKRQLDLPATLKISEFDV